MPLRLRGPSWGDESVGNHRDSLLYNTGAEATVLNKKVSPRQPAPTINLEVGVIICVLRCLASVLKFQDRLRLRVGLGCLHGGKRVQHAVAPRHVKAR